jgi:hypothetical protein
MIWMLSPANVKLIGTCLKGPPGSGPPVPSTLFQLTWHTAISLKRLAPAGRDDDDDDDDDDEI